MSWNLLLGDLLKLSGCDLGQPALGIPARIGVGPDGLQKFLQIPAIL